MKSSAIPTVRYAFFLLSSLSILILSYTNPLYAETTKAPSPMSEIKTTIDQIVDTVQTFPGPEKTETRRGKLREIINPKFDFREMAKRSLGASWSQITPEQQEEFVVLFSNLLAKTYLNRIETVKPGMVKIDGEDLLTGSPEDPFQKAVVKTSVTHNGDTFPINYRVINRNGAWQVYDVIIENIGLVANYRTEFAGILRKEKIDGLLQRLREKQ